MHEGYLSSEHAGNNQKYFATELKNFDKGINTFDKDKKQKYFLNILGLFFSAREKTLNHNS